MEEWIYKKYLNMTNNQKDFDRWLETYAEDIDEERKLMEKS